MPRNVDLAAERRRQAALSKRVEYLHSSALYGSWSSFQAATGRCMSVESYVAAALKGNVDVDVQAVADDFRAALNAALPEGVVIRGDCFYGPSADRPEWGAEVVAAAIGVVDFWGIVSEHDPDNT